MKKVIFALAMLVIAAPAWAAVDITVEDEGGGVAAIYYDASTAPNLVRAFALDIVVSDGNILSVDDTVNDDYTIYPGTIVIAGDGTVTDYGTPVAPQSDLPSDTLGGLGTGGMTVEMGSLYYPTDDASPNAPPNAGLLLRFTVEENTCVTITENLSRGGVVLTDPTVPADVNTAAASVCLVLDCLPTSDPGYEFWANNGKPPCWCYPRQCHGDADGLSQGKNNYYVATDDLDILVAAWAKPIENMSGNQICADFNHLPQGKQNYRVATDDLDILVANWAIANGPAGDCLP